MNSMESLRPFLDGLEEGVLFLDRNRCIIAINRAASRMIGQDCDAVIGQFCPGLFNGTECARACAAREDCALIPTRDQQTRMLDLAMDRPDGVQIILRMWAVLLSDEAGLERYAIILRDRTREALLEEEARERLRLGGMIGHSPAMRELFRAIMRAAISNATVLIQGESGTGKELIAKALHDNSTRSKGPYVRVHCASFPDTLLESELFGHVKGAFTGARSDRIGRFEAAHGGTILLDEIGEISPVTQVKLLRVLQEREVERLGENKPRTVDIRIVTATNRDLAAMVRQGRFREDLYYRLNVLPIQAPPLRERLGDVPLLVEVLLEELSQQYGRDGVRFSGEAMAILNDHDWPGNVRELGNVLEYALVHSLGRVIRPEHLPMGALKKIAPSGKRAFAAAEPSSRKVAHYYRKTSDESERKRILDALRETGGNKVLAAEKLGMSRTTLWHRLKRYGMDKGCDSGQDDREKFS
ncbi:MAG: sigma 54-interacting transcriptional regulator [Magnetococcales bacterium]|nr:sigma 54-interacting transcriptional regulator [Magnetococcales bacterium]